MTPKAFHALFGRIGAWAKMPFPVHPHMLRHACGYALANAGHDTRSLQVALRFLNDASIALAHFAKVGQGTSNPITLARGQGRAAEALGKTNDARAHYETAARYSTAYYGQLARARLGLKDIVLWPPPDPAPARMDVVRAIEILYAIGERDLIAGGLAELGERSTDMATLAAVGEVTARHKDARAMLLLGKAALGRGLPLEHFAFPTVGIPDTSGMCHKPTFRQC